MVVGLAIVGAACGGGASAGGGAPGEGKVVSVIDGDTLVVRVGGHDEHVRIIGIDTPETKKPNTPVECYGTEASHRMGELLPAGTVVRLERDREARDRYDRLLAYVYRASDGLLVEEEMLRGGYAAPLAIAPNTAHQAGFASIAANAKSAGTGLWGVCGGNHVVGARGAGG